MNKLDSHLQAYQGRFIYEFDNQIQMNWYPKRILDFADADSSILELGLGHGITTDLFSQYFKKHVVIDASPAVIENFKKEFPSCKAEIVEGYFETFETKDKFDLIIMGFVMEHVDDPDIILNHFKQFLKPNGKIYITVPNAEVMNRRLGNFAGDLPDMQLLSEHDHICGHQRYFTVKTLSDQIKNNGFKVDRIEGIYLKPMSTKQMISLELDQKYIDALCQLGVSYPELCCGIFVEFSIKK